MFRVYNQDFTLNVFEAGEKDELALANRKLKTAENYEEGMMLFNYSVTRPKKGMPVLSIEYGCQK